jgi:hypothetical protein
MIRFAYWITEATDTHSEYVILIAFPLQQCINERASNLRYTYIGSLVYVIQQTTPKCAKNYSQSDWILFALTDTQLLSKPWCLAFYRSFSQNNQIL